MKRPTSKRPPSPFPRKLPSGATIIDEECACGALRSEHGDHGFAWGHGRLPSTGCVQFTWKRFITKLGTVES